MTEKQKAYVQDGDVGCGAVGSLSWHKAAVAEMDRMGRLMYLSEVLPGMKVEDGYNFMTFLIAEAIQDGDGN